MIASTRPSGHAGSRSNTVLLDGIVYCSGWVATNHSDAVAIPFKDRRVSVVRNGAAMTPAERADIVAWIAAPGSIAALARFLAARDLSQFDMYVPLKSVGKDRDGSSSRCHRSRMPARHHGGPGKPWIGVHPAALGTGCWRQL